MTSVRVAGTAASAAKLRPLIRADLAMLPEPVREEVALVSSELLGNAVRHARALDDGQIAVDWRIGPYGVEIAVTDGGGPTLPVAQAAEPTDTAGRGLSIVASLASSWGVERDGSGTTVWAVVPLLDSVVTLDADHSDAAVVHGAVMRQRTRLGSRTLVRPGGAGTVEVPRGRARRAYPGPAPLDG